MKRPGIFNARKFRQLRNKQRKEQQLSIRKAEFETFEPRLLLSADISPITVDFDNKENNGISLLLDAPELANETPVVLTDVVLDKSDETPDSESSLLFNQLVFLDLDGAQDVVYEGPVTVNDVDVDAFAAPDSLTDQTDDIIDAMLAELDKDFAGFGVQFTTDSPLDGVDFSTIYIGGDGAAFSEYGTFIGLSEQVDEGNLDKTDKAFVFADNIEFNSLSSASEFGQRLAEIVGHETGHLLGFQHEHEIDSANAGPLDDLAWKPYTHVEMAKEVRDDIMADGQITIAGDTYDIHPLVKEAITYFPSYYYAGAVGPDGFPDLVMGQSIVHPNDTGVWISHILDKAWEAQRVDSPYNVVEKSQILAFAYGYATHAIGDTFAHTMVNQFTGGPFPDLADVVTQLDPFENAFRHNVIEAYLMTANPGYYDGERLKLATGDVSNSSSPGIAFDAPSQFIYEALTRDLPDLPGQTNYELFNTVPDSTGNSVLTGSAFADDVALSNHLQTITDTFNSNGGNAVAMTPELVQLFADSNVIPIASIWGASAPALTIDPWTLTDPDTGAPILNPITGEPIVITDGVTLFGGVALSANATIKPIFVDTYTVTGEGDAMTVTKNTPNAPLGWVVKSDYSEYLIRYNAATPAFTDTVTGEQVAAVPAHFSIEEIQKSRGVIVDPFVVVRNLLFQFQNSQLFKNSYYTIDVDTDFGEPLAGVIDRLIKGAEGAIRGEVGYTFDDMKADLQGVWDELDSLVGPIVNKLIELMTTPAGQSPDYLGFLEMMAGYAQDVGRAPLVTLVSYVDYWMRNIDDALMNWGEVNLAVSKVLFDPETTRDLQNAVGKPYGPDVTDVRNQVDENGNPISKLGFDSRGEAEAGVTAIDVLLRELND
ncbi:MAG: LEPR-XLL domain-containing protein, partial [Gammaproteobacteria bacterium]